MTSYKPPLLSTCGRKKAFWEFNIRQAFLVPISGEAALDHHVAQVAETVFGHHMGWRVVAVVLTKVNSPFPSCSRFCFGTVEFASDHNESTFALRSPFATPVIAELVQQFRGGKYPVILLSIF